MRKTAASCRTGTGRKKTTQTMSLIKALKNINYATSDKGIPEGLVLDSIKMECDYVAQMLDGLTPIQAVLLSVVVMESATGDKCSPTDICQHLGIDGYNLLELEDDLRTLVNGSYVFFSRGRMSDDAYSAAPELMESVKCNTPYVRPTRRCENEQKLFELFDKLLCRRDDGDLGQDGLRGAVDNVLDENGHLPFAVKFRQLSEHISDSEVLVLLLICVKFFRDPKSSVNPREWRFLFDRGFRASLVARDLETGRSPLVRENLVTLSVRDNMLAGDEYVLTDMAVAQLFPGQAKASCLSAVEGMVVSHKSIAKKDLFYNAGLQRQVDDLVRLLQPKNLAGVQSRLRKCGMHTGFCCLFYGEAGAGKTELARQLAKATGRDLVQVDLSQIRSKWVGESEKNVQSVFDRYRKAVKAGGRCPILLFNEADAIMNKRLAGADTAVDKSENTLANIILQNLEEFDDGILIATTNLASTNMDPAYERRFIYKLEFERPDEAVRVKIWQSMLGDEDQECLEKLSREFDFTGGQIANIAKKRMVDEILSGHKAGYADLRDYCTQECISGSHGGNVGFRINNG